MTHEQLHDRLLELVYGELAPREARKVEEHAAGCETCRIELARIRETRRLMSGLPQEPAPHAGERVLVAAAREAARRRAPPRTLPRWLWGGSIVAASLAAVVTVSYRIVAMRPEPLGREDPDALMGDSPYAHAPENVVPAPPAGAEKPATAAEPAPPAPERKAAPRRRERAAAGPQSAAPEPERAPSRFAMAPPARSAEEPAGAPAAPTAAEASPGAAAGISERERREEPRQAYATADATAAEGDETSPRAPPPAAAPASRPRAKAPAPAASRAAELAAPAGVDPLARYEALRATGRLRAEERTFPGCELELWRRVERDPDGRVVSYAWDQMIGTRRVRLEAIYGPDGTLARKRALDVASSAPATVKFTVPPASSVDVEAPSRCDR